MNTGAWRWLGVTLAVLALGSALAAGLAWRSYERFLATPMVIADATSQGTTVLRVRPGDTLYGMLDQLERRGITSRDWRWQVLLRLRPGTMQAGEYALPAGLTPVGLLELLASGEVIQYRFTLVEGWNYRQLRKALLAEERLAVAPERLADNQVMTEIGSDLPHPEGWFLPETYSYTASDNAIDLLRRAHADMQHALEDAWATRADDLPLASPYELLILASIVEKESSLAAERPRVAGVFVRRLQQNWRLETDPTVIYGLGDDYDGNIRRRDLRESTPYNTYVIRGLPPTPIAMPGAATLQATAHPAEESAMFFVADGEGGHVFSSTLEEHNRAVEDFLRWYRNRDKAAAKTPPESD